MFCVVSFFKPENWNNDEGLQSLVRIRRPRLLYCTTYFSSLMQVRKKVSLFSLSTVPTSVYTGTLRPINTCLLSVRLCLLNVRTLTGISLTHGRVPRLIIISILVYMNTTNTTNTTYIDEQHNGSTCGFTSSSFFGTWEAPRYYCDVLSQAFLALTRLPFMTLIALGIKAYQEYQCSAYDLIFGVY
jgi:hypothetical protein